MALGPLGWEAAWLAEVDVAASAVLAYHYGATVPRFPPSFEDDPPEKKGARTAEQKSAAYERSKKRIAWGDRLTNWGDMTRLPDLIRSGEVEAPELLCGGTPCQSFSIAGLREGLRDPRGGLTLTFVEIVDAIDERRAAAGLEPCVALWENVPGVLSLSHADNPFGCFLAALAGEDVPLVPSGKRWPNAGVVLGPKRAVAWRVGDAQYFGLAQRRNRVYVVASARDGADPAGILLEFGGVRRDSAPSRETGSEVAGTLDARTTGGGFPGTDGACSGHAVPAFRSDLAHRGVEAFGGGDTRGALSAATTTTTKTRIDFDTETFVVHGTQGPIVQRDCAMPLGRNNGGENAVLTPIVIPFDTTQITSRLNRSTQQPGDPCHPLSASGHAPAIAYSETPNAYAQEADASSLLSTMRDEIGAEAYAEWGLGVLAAFQSSDVLRAWLHGAKLRDATKDFRPELDDGSPPRPQSGPTGSVREVWFNGPNGRSSQGRGLAKQLAGEPGTALSVLPHPSAQPETELLRVQQAAHGARLLCEALSAVCQMGPPIAGYAERVVNSVRRLTPKEAERLQGFPDGYTHVPIGKALAADGPRYKQTGNSWAVNHVRWIGRRLTAHLDDLDSRPSGFEDLLG